MGPGEATQGATLDRYFGSASVHVDLDSDNRLLGIELLGVSRLLRPEAVPRGA
jgi:hypothetical protein